MKTKTLMFIFTLLLSKMTLAQFEGGICEPSFIKFSQTHTGENIVGKIIGYVDYIPGSIVTGNQMTTGQGLELSLMLIRDPKDLKLLRNKTNLIVTDEGIINIYFYKGAWRLFFFDKKIHPLTYTEHGSRVFTLK